jgi:hypothetical protein
MLQNLEEIRTWKKYQPGVELITNVCPVHLELITDVHPGRLEGHLQISYQVGGFL